MNFTCCGPAYPDIVIDRLDGDGDDLFGVVLGFECTECFNSHVLSAQVPIAQVPHWQVLNVLAPNVQVPNALRVKCPMVGCPCTEVNSFDLREGLAQFKDVITPGLRVAGNFV